MKSKLTLLAVITFVLVGLTSPIQLIGIPVSALLALIFGVLAAMLETRVDGEAGGRRASKVVGSAAFGGSLVALAVLALVVVNLPGVPEFIQASEPHPEARIALDMMTPLAGAAGLLGGFIVGLVNLVVALVAGYLTTMFRTHGAKLTA